VLKHVSHIKICTLLLLLMLAAKSNSLQAQQLGINDTITVEAIVYNGDTIESKTLSNLDLYAKYPPGKTSLYAQWNRLRNAVFVTYPYAIKAGVVLNDINLHLEGVTDKSKRRKYIKSREKELKKEFSDPLTNLSIYQGKVLMKLINRETGNNCYEIVKEYKGGAVARFYQTVAFFFGSNLKQPYDINGDEKEMEKIVIEVERMYGYRS